MADRVSASITIGGKVTADQFTAITDMILWNDLRTEWDGPEFTPDQITKGEPLALHVHETPWGMFDDLEQYCCDQQIAYKRWSGGSAGNYGPERIVYDGKHGPLNYDVDDDDHVVSTRIRLNNWGRCAPFALISKPLKSPCRHWS
jgi:hypothetical protein